MTGNADCGPIVHIRICAATFGTAALGAAKKPVAKKTGKATAGAVSGADVAVFQRALAINALPADQRNAIVAKAGLDLELSIAKLSGLEQALGGPDAARAALQAAWAPVGADIAAAKADVVAPKAKDPAAPAVARFSVFGSRSYVGLQTTAVPNISDGLFGAENYIALTELVVDHGNYLAPDSPELGRRIPPTGDDWIRNTDEGAEANFTAKHTDSNGLSTSLVVNSTVNICPDANGVFTTKGTAKITVTLGAVGQIGTIEVNTTGQLDDNASIASSEFDYRMQWSKFNGGNGEFVDVSGHYVPGVRRVSKVTRTGGTATQALADEAVDVGARTALFLSDRLNGAAKRGWESGRCVVLQATATPGPTGLKPGETSTINSYAA